MGTARREIHTVSPGFSRADESAPDTAGSAVLYGRNIPISGQADSRESAPYKEKRTLPGALANVSGFVCVTALDPEGPLSASGFGNINPIPFRYIQATSVSDSLARFRTEFSYLLGPTDPCSTAVHMEPFSTSVFKVLV